MDRRMLLGLKFAQLRPARIAAVVVAVQIGVDGVQRLTANRAEPGAVRPAEELARKGGGHRIVDPARQVQLAPLDIGASELLVALARLIDLARVDFDRDGGAFEAAHAGTLETQREAQAEGVTGAGPRDVEPGVDRLRRCRVGLAGELEAAGTDRYVKAGPLSVGKRQ